jgi:hypothetical protein
LTTATATAVRTHAAYVDVHTARNPKGEIRGQIALGVVPTLQLLDLRDGATLTLPFAVRYAVTGFSIGGSTGKIVVLANVPERPTLEPDLSTPGVAYLPDDKMLSGRRDLTFVLARPTGEQLANREARVTVYGVTLAGRK